MHKVLAPSHRQHPRCGRTLECWAWSLNRARRMRGGVLATHVAHDIQALLSVVEPRRPVAARRKLADGEEWITEHRLKPWVYESIHRREIRRQHGVTVDVAGVRPSVHRCQRPHGEGGNVRTWQARCRLIDVRVYRGIDAVVCQADASGPCTATTARWVGGDKTGSGTVFDAGAGGYSVSML